MVGAATERYDPTDISSRVNLRTIAQAYLGQPQKSRRDHDKYYSPTRSERTASFAVYSDHVFDYGSQERLNPFEFIELVEHCDFTRAVTILADIVGQRRTVTPRPIPQPALRIDEPPSAEWQRKAATLVEDAKRYLRSDRPDTHRVRTYLHEIRGLSDEEIDRENYGYNPQARRIKIGEVTHYLPSGIIIPWYTDGALMAVRIRRLVGNLAEALSIADDIDDKGEPVAKYTSLTGSKPSQALYGADDMQPDRPILIVEGEFDCALGQQLAGDLINIVTRGSASASNMPSRMLALFEGAPRVFAALDSDSSGEKGKAKLKETLPTIELVSYPTGKDLTEFVMSGGDLLAWIVELLTQPVPVQLISDGVRSAFLNCKLDAALIVYELAALAGIRPEQGPSKPQLKEANKRLGLDINDKMIDRGVDQVAEYFSTTSGRVFLKTERVLESSNPDFVETRMDRCFPTVNTVKATLCDLLPWRLLERMYSSWSDEFPKQKVADLVGAIDGLSGDEQTALVDELIAYCQVRGGEVKMRRYVKALRTLLKMLDDPHSTPLPAGWVNGSRYRRIYLNALVAANNTIHRGYGDIALLVGVNESNSGDVIKGANLENHTDPKLIALPERGNIATFAFKAAKGLGKIYEVLYIDHLGKPITDTSQPFDPATVQAWADSAPPLVTLAIRVRVKGRQTVVGPVKPPAPRRTKATRAENVPEIDAPATPKTRPIVAKPAPRPVYLGAGPDPLRLRDFLLDVYQSKHGEVIAQAVHDSLSVIDAARLVILRAEPATIDLIKTEFSEPLHVRENLTKLDISSDTRARIEAEKFQHSSASAASLSFMQRQVELDDLHAKAVREVATA